MGFWGQLCCSCQSQHSLCCPPEHSPVNTTKAWELFALPVLSSVRVTMLLCWSVTISLFILIQSAGILAFWHYLSECLKCTLLISSTSELIFCSTYRCFCWLLVESFRPLLVLYKSCLNQHNGRTDKLGWNNSQRVWNMLLWHETYKCFMRSVSSWQMLLHFGPAQAAPGYLTTNFAYSQLGPCTDVCPHLYSFLPLHFCSPGEV